MIDLHLHLDGSLSPEFLLALAKEQNKDISLNKIKNEVVCKSSCTSLNEYLKCFDLPLLLMQTYDSLYKATYHLIEKLNSQGIVYAEIRFAPQLHTKQGLSIDEIINAVLQAVNDAKSHFDTMCQIILCCMRGNTNSEQNIQTIKVGSKYLYKGVCAIDLAGAEALYKTGDFAYMFDVAKSVNMPFVIHAGESDGVESVRWAVKFGASRIGHGIALKDDIALMQEVKEKNIAIEMCPSSNLQTKAIKSIYEFPIKRYLDFGLMATVNTDNMTVSNTTIKSEMLLLDKIGVTAEEKEQLILNSVKASFLSESDKTKIKNKVLTRLNK